MAAAGFVRGLAVSHATHLDASSLLGIKHVSQVQPLVDFLNKPDRLDPLEAGA